MPDTLLFTREPVIDKKQKIVANRLIAHGPDITALVNTLTSLADIWPQQTMLLSLNGLLPTRELAEKLASSNTVMELPVQILAQPSVEEVLLQLRATNTSACLCCFSPDTPLPDQGSWRFILMDGDGDQASRPHSYSGMLLANGITDAHAFQLAMADGFDGASGWFFLDEPPAPKPLLPAYAQLVRLIALACNEADTQEIEAILKQDVAISYRLLRYLNSAGFGLTGKIGSFRHAVTILGYHGLRKWLSLLLLTASRAQSASAMMQAAVVRACIMEQLGKVFFDETQLDSLFITGAFSLLPYMLSASMQDILTQINLPDTVSSALLHQKGEFAPLLKLAIGCEGTEADGLRRQMQELDLTAGQVNRAQIAALAFADSIQSPPASVS